MLVAFATALTVHFFRAIPLGRQHKELATALAVERALALRLQPHAGPIAEAEAKAALSAATSALSPALKAALQRTPLDLAQVETALPKPLVIISVATKAQVVRPVATIARARIVEPLSEPLPFDHADDWMADAEAVSLRGLERGVIDVLIARTDQPELCPVDIRLDDRKALGVAVDAVLAAAAPELPTDALQPLCRRERQRRLAHEALKPLTLSFPFAPGLLLDDVERALLDRLQDPTREKGLGAKPRQLMYSMMQNDEAIRAEAATLRPTVERLLAELAFEAAVTAPRDACAYVHAYSASPNRARFLAGLYNRFLGERWPEERERNAILAFLYALAHEKTPETGIASAAQLTLLWQKTSRLPSADACASPPPSYDGSAAETLGKIVLD